MAYKWKPNATQRKEFAERMKNTDEKLAYEKRKADKKMYENWKDKDFTPTKEQYDFCMNNSELFATSEQQDAFNMVTSAYSLNEKTNHCYIHIINELRRSIVRV